MLGNLYALWFISSIDFTNLIGPDSDIHGDLPNLSHNDKVLNRYSSLHTCILDCMQCCVIFMHCEFISSIDFPGSFNEVNEFGNVDKHGLYRGKELAN